MLIDRPAQWRKYESGMCNGCQSLCCTMPVEVTLSDLTRMGLVTEDEAVQASPRKILRRLEAEKIVLNYRAKTQLFTLKQKANGDCQYLDEKRLCKIYDKRPETCRNFPAKGPRPGFCPQIKRK